MSKAFTKEDDDREEEVPEDPQPVGPQYITPQGYKRLGDELDHLWKVERPRVTREVEAAAALGDRSENAEYIYGKKRLREIDRRLRYLSKRLERVTVVQSTPDQVGKVFFGATVTLLDDEGKRVSYRLVGVDEIDLEKRWISLASPIGKALLGKRLGELVTVRRPKGEVEFEVTAISYEAQPES